MSEILNSYMDSYAKSHRYRMSTPKEALAFMDTAKAYHEGQIKLPPEIIALNAEIEAKTKNAERLCVLFRQLDMGAIHEIVALRREKDRLYMEWGISESHRH